MSSFRRSTPHKDYHQGNLPLAVFKPFGPEALADEDGQYTPLVVDGDGALYVKIAGTVTTAGGGQTRPLGFFSAEPQDPFDEVGDGTEAPLAMSKWRALHVNLRDPGSGAPIGTSGNPLYVVNVSQAQEGGEDVPVLFVQIASGTVINSTNEGSITNTGVGNRTIPLTTLAVGDQLRIKAWGWGRQTGSPTLTWRLKVGGTIFCATAANDPSFDTTVPSRWEIDAIITIQSTGVGGSASSQMNVKRITNTGSNVVGFSIPNVGPNAINTTVDNEIDITAQWNAASIHNFVTCSDIVIEKLRV